MNVTPDQINQIVQRVLQQLQQREATAHARVGNAQPQSGLDAKPVAQPLEPKRVTAGVGSADQQPSPPARRRLDQKVITEEVLSRESRGARHLEFANRAVLTPTALDYLRQHKLTWSRAASGSPGPSPASARMRRTAILLHTSNRTVERLANELARNRSDCEVELTNDRQSAISGAVSRICRGDNQRIIVLTADEYQLASELNRHARIHAATVGCRRTALRALSQMPVNAFCIAADQHNYFELKNLFKALL